MSPLSKMQINGQQLNSILPGLSKLSPLQWNLAWHPQEGEHLFSIPVALGMSCHNDHLVLLPLLYYILTFSWGQRLSFVYLFICPSGRDSACHIIDIHNYSKNEGMKTWVSEKSNSIAGFKEHFLASLRDTIRQYVINCWVNHLPVIATDIRGGVLYIFLYPPEHLSQWLAHSGSAVNALWMNNHCFWIKWWWAIEEQAV